MQRGGVKLWCRATFHVGHFRAFIRNNECALELAEVFGVDTEISLERVLYLHTRWDVNERTTAKNGGVQRAKFVVGDRDDLTKPLPEYFRMML